MRRLLVPLLLLLIACRALSPGPVATPASLPASPTSLSTPFYLTTSTPSPGSELSKTPFPTATLAPLPDVPFTVRVHPDGPLYVGDLVSLEVIPPQDVDLEGHSVQVQVDESQGISDEKVGFESYGIGGRTQATLLWAWDTSGLTVGEHSLKFSVQPGDLTWTETVSLLPENGVPPPEPGAIWATTESDCCLVYYITGTDAERDLPDLLAMTDEQAEKAKQLLGVEISEPISIVFLPRVLGHGGFASQEIAVSYLDRNYTGSNSEVVLHHEIIHILDGRLGGELRPTILIEGLAVYLTGGHFKPELLMPRAAALLPSSVGCTQPPSVPSNGEYFTETMGCGLDWYIPLGQLMDDFYFSQHEIGYLQAGALVEFMVETWGWDAFSDFYRDIHPPPQPSDENQQEGGTQSQAMDIALQKHFGINLDTLDGRFQHALRQQTLTPELVEDVRLTVEFYDTVRRYQQLLDPSAYFMTAWLPDSAQMRERGIVADYLRRPSLPENIALETMMVAAYADLRSGNFPRVAQMLTAVNAALDTFAYGGAQLFTASPLTNDFRAVARAAGFQPPKGKENGTQLCVSKAGPEIFVSDPETEWIGNCRLRTVKK